MIDQLDLLAALKNNPYRDKRTGRFSFAPGGPRIPGNYTKEYHEAVEDLQLALAWSGDDPNKWTADEASEIKLKQSRVQELSQVVEAEYRLGEIPLVKLRIGLDVPVERGIIKHLPGQHNQQTHGRGMSPGRIVDQDKRVWQGQQAAGKKTISKLETGELGERAAMMALEDVYGQPFETLNVGMNNAPIDVIGDHTAVEVKAGMSTNGKTAQHWRATIGQPGKAEREALKQMTPKEKRAHNQRKSEAIIQRKAELLQQLSREAGSEIKGKTVGVILSPDGKQADVFMVDGFHLRLPWQKYATGDNYIGTYNL